MKTRTFVSFSAAAALLLFWCGCGLLTPPEQPGTTFYTIPAPHAVTGAPGITIRRLQNDSGAAYKMRYLTGSGKVVIDDYRQWIDMPQTMVANILRTDFPAGERELFANIFLWDIDITAAEIRLGIAWNTVPGNISERRIYTAALTEVSPEAAAAAFSNAIGQWEKDLAE